MFQKSTNEKQEFPVAAMFVNEPGQNEQFLQRTCHRRFLPSFGSFGKAVSEEKFLKKLTNQKQELPVAAMFVNGSEINEHLLQRPFHRCFLPSFGSFGQAVSEEKIFQKSTNQKQELPVVAMFVNGSGRKEYCLQRTFHRCFLIRFRSFGQAISEKKIFQKSTNQKQELPVVAMFVIGSGRNEQSFQSIFHKCVLPSFGSFGQAVSENIFQKLTNQKQELPVAAMFVNGSGRDSNLYREPSIDASYQVSVHLAKQFQRRRMFRNQPIRNRNCLQWPCLLTDRD